MSRSRNWLILAVALALALGLAYFLRGPGGHGPGSLVVYVLGGGDYQKAQHKDIFAPFSEHAGIRVLEEAHSGEYAGIESRILSGTCPWDVVQVESNFLIRGSQRALFLPIDYNVVDTPGLISAAKRPLGVVHVFWASVLAWNRDRVPTGFTPQGWSDFFDLKKYPGPRGLRKTPRVNLEIALLADGVLPAELYPLDVDRALTKLDSIRPSISWWTSGAELQQKLVSEFAMAQGWNGRVWATKRDGAHVDMTLNQALFDADWWVVPRCAPHPDSAMRFLAFASQKEAGVKIAEDFAYAPANAQAFGLISPRVLPYLSSTPENLQREVAFNAQWWADNEDRVTQRWLEWLGADVVPHK